MGERICVLKDGVIQQVDTPTALYDRPANAFVAGFIGSPEMNIQEATLGSGPAGATLQLGGETVPLPASVAVTLGQHTGAVKFGLRPEHVSVQPRPEGDSVPVVGRLRALEHMGNEVFVHFDIGAVPMTARVPADQLHGLAQAERGAVHHFHLQMARGHLFSAASGARLC